MNELNHLNEKLELLRRGMQEFDMLRNRLGELEAVTRAIAHSNQNMVSDIQNTQRLIAQWEYFFEHSLDMLCIADERGYFTEVNPSFQRALGYSKEELLSIPYLELIHPDDIDATKQTAQSLFDGCDTVSFDNRYRRKDGSYIWLNWTCPAPTETCPFLYAIARDITERKRSESEVLYRAQHDELTDLFNRAAFMQELRFAVERHKRDPVHDVCLFYLDLNNFKPINDQYGHHIGDEVLRQISARIKSTCRATDLPARLGGDEFTVLYQATNTIDALALKARLHALLNKPVLIHTQTLQLGVSIGMARLSAEDETAQAFLNRADQDMYTHKFGGVKHPAASI